MDRDFLFVLGGCLLFVFAVYLIVVTKAAFSFLASKNPDPRERILQDGQRVLMSRLDAEWLVMCALDHDEISFGKACELLDLNDWTIQAKFEGHQQNNRRTE